MSSAPQDEAEQNIQMWKVKKLIKSLNAARGAGTSMISLIIPPRAQISQIQNMLTQEYGTASNIKSRVNRLSVLAAITSTQQRLKLYNRVPPNGLVLFVGTILTDEGKEKKVSFDFEPHKPINTSLYLCDNKFHTEALEELLESDAKFGFIVMDGNGSLFGTLAGNTREVIHKFTVDLPKKHGRGGTQAIDLAAESLANVKFVQEKKLIEKYFDEINLDSGKYCFGIDDTLKGLEMGAVETLIVWENLPHMRYVLRNAAGGRRFRDHNVRWKLTHGRWHSLEEIVVYGNKENEKDKEKFMDKSTGQEMEQAAEPQSLLEWFAERYRDFGAKLEFVTNRSQEGSQFVKGFGGIGGILRYKVDMSNLAGPEEDDDEFYDTDEEPM
ncbi:Polypeptide release factor (eRF1) in translation termination [Tulasnella sp. UAMH 9824]|nr:Polypeptide release factor (eRF1) in translation termination [Tulasnella sp. UAMH 9824]